MSPGHQKAGRGIHAPLFCFRPVGGRLQELLTQEDLDHRPFPIEGWIRDSLVIFQESIGQQYRFGMPGPETVWKPCQ